MPSFFEGETEQSTTQILVQSKYDSPFRLQSGAFVGVEASKLITPSLLQSATGKKRVADSENSEETDCPPSGKRSFLNSEYVVLQTIQSDLHPFFLAEQAEKRPGSKIEPIGGKKRAASVDRAESPVRRGPPRVRH